MNPPWHLTFFRPRVNHGDGAFGEVICEPWEVERYARGLAARGMTVCAVPLDDDDSMLDAYWIDPRVQNVRANERFL